MADDVNIKDVKKIFFRIRGRFIKTIREVVEPAFKTALEPVVIAAEGLAPSKTNRLRDRIGVVVRVTQYRVFAAITPVRLGRGDKQYPFYGLFQEKGWWLTTHTAKGARDTIAANRKLTRGERRGRLSSLKATRRRIKFIQGHPFLKPAALGGVAQAFETWKPLVIAGFERFSNAETEAEGASGGSL
jgi:hypothetical protein